MKTAMRRRLATWFCSLCLAGGLYAQGSADPVIMKINGKDVLRSEFEYNFNKNNGDEVADRKTVDEYVDLFVNYKLKVEAALDGRYDTLTSFRNEFRTYRDQQIRPYLVTPAAEENELRRYYEQMKAAIEPDGLIRASHILVRVPQKASAQEMEAAKARIDSIYAALKGGADFATLAKQCSDDKNSGARGGDLGGWVAKGQTLKEFENVAFALDVNELSEPFQSPLGYHVILLREKKHLDPYETLKPQIQHFLESRGLREHIAGQVVDSLAKASGGKLTAEEVLEQKTAELCGKDQNLKYLIQEYHDGLLLFEISNREVWDKAARDTAGLEAYFRKNRSKYKWDAPRYKGIVYHCSEKDLLKQVRKLLKSVDEDAWVDTLRAVFNQDSLKQIRAEKNLFKKGDDAFVDHLVFKEKKEPQPLEAYPYTDVYGKKLKKPKEWTDVRGEVVSDYQAACEADFVRKLRETYKVEIYKEVLNTVNKH